MGQNAWTSILHSIKEILHALAKISPESVLVRDIFGLIFFIVKL